MKIWPKYLHKTKCYYLIDTLMNETNGSDL